MTTVCIHAKFVQCRMPVLVVLGILARVDGMQWAISAMIVLVKVSLVTLLIGLVWDFETLCLLEERTQ